MLRGSEDLKAYLERRIGPREHLSADGRFSWEEVECMGACANAPMVSINDRYYEDLDPESLARIIDEFDAGRPPSPGSAIGRQGAAPEGGPLTLLDAALYDGSRARPIETLPNAPAREPAA
jgi:NADH-quinone oxidoreductase subunit E